MRYNLKLVGMAKIKKMDSNYWKGVEKQEASDFADENCAYTLDHSLAVP